MHEDLFTYDAAACGDQLKVFKFVLVSVFGYLLKNRGLMVTPACVHL